MGATVAQDHNNNNLRKHFYEKVHTISQSLISLVKPTYFGRTELWTYTYMYVQVLAI